jgi:nicotinamide phosphoribosyltransferase
MSNNIILKCDSYKLSQWKQYPKNTTKIFSYIESRGGSFGYTVFFGLQYYLKKYFTTPFTQADIDYAEKRALAHGEPFNREGWEYILKTYGGLLPLRIRAVPEGTVLDVKNVLVTVENTDDNCFWLTSIFETLLLKIWYPITVATLSNVCRQIIRGYLLDTADNADGLNFKLHDFGYRGVSSEESAAIGGASHLLNFLGTDTIAGLEMLTEFYGADMAGFSIPASEHSTVTSWLRENEFDAYHNMLEQFGNGPIFACVSDSYNIFDACKMWGKMKDEIIAKGCTVVVRPDSGDPEQMSVSVVQELDKYFGSTVNTKGFRVLNNVRVIYGDGISEPRVIRNILANLKIRGYSADNIAFGMGGGLLQKIDRDTLKFAMKCCAAVVDGEVREIYKEPFNQPDKKSKKGFLDLVKTENGYETLQCVDPNVANPNSVLRTVYENGKVLVDENLDTIRARVWEQDEV